MTSKVKKPEHDDFKKLVRLLGYLQGTIDLPLTLGANKTGVVKWWADASYAVRNDMKSQTGGTASLGRGSVISMSKKQKLNTKSSTEAELVAADDVMAQMIWTKNFLVAQGYKIQKNVLFQDNQSAILLEKNSTESSSKRTQHINIRYFSVKDIKNKKKSLK